MNGAFSGWMLNGFLSGIQPDRRKMYKLEVMAAFAHNNMPKGDLHLTKEQALDAAAYVTDQQRPNFTKDSEAW